MNEPLTDAQRDYIVRLLGIIGKSRYQSLKAELGIEANTTINRMTKNEAARLIRRMILAKRGR